MADNTKKMKLYKHQTNGVEKGKQGNLALFWECGTGKTLTTIEIIKHHGGKALVVCPLSIIDAAWLEDIQKFAPELTAVSLHDKKPAKRRERLAEDHDIYIINFAGFKILYKDICAKGFTTLVIDESSCMRNPRSQQTMSILSLAGVKSYGAKKKGFVTDRPIQHRYVLSGTPASNGEIEYWSQIKFITGPGGRVFNDNFYAFRGQWFVDKFARANVKFQDWCLPKERRQAFIDKMAPVCDVVRKADALDLPPQVHEKRIVELSKQEQAAYNTFKDDMVLEFSDATVLSSNALTEILRLRQLTSGFVYTEAGAKETGRTKIKELNAVLDEIGRDKPVIIWANFRHEIETLVDELPGAVALYGGTEDKGAVIKDFVDGKTQYLVANPQSSAHGWTGVHCSHSIYFSLGYSYELLKQSQDRVHRLGQVNSVTYYYLLAKGTIDMVIYKALINKQDLSDSLLDYLKGM